MSDVNPGQDPDPNFIPEAPNDGADEGDHTIDNGDPLEDEV